MNPLILAPVLLAVVALVVGSLLPARVEAAAGVRVITAAVLLATGAAVVAGVHVVLAGLAMVPAVSDLLGWCGAVYAHHGATPIAGALAAAVLLAMLARAAGSIRAARRDVAQVVAGPGLTVVDIDVPVALAVPGGGVVVGARLLEGLDDEGRAVVLAHERAHLDLHHHRYVRAVDACAAALPFIRPLARRVRFLNECWADAVAAEVVGSREAVARAIARVALMGPTGRDTRLLAFAQDGTLERVRILMEPPVRTSVGVRVTAIVLAGTVAGGAVVQFHHLTALAVGLWS
ncbi:MAG: M48 family metalloprotease [Actinomycetes bacterium]